MLNPAVECCLIVATFHCCVLLKLIDAVRVSCDNYRSWLFYAGSSATTQGQFSFIVNRSLPRWVSSNRFVCSFIMTTVLILLRSA